MNMIDIASWEEIEYNIYFAIKKFLRIKFQSDVFIIVNLWYF